MAPEHEDRAATCDDEGAQLHAKDGWRMLEGFPSPDCIMEPLYNPFKPYIQIFILWQKVKILIV